MTQKVVTLFLHHMLLEVEREGNKTSEALEFLKCVAFFFQEKHLPISWTDSVPGNYIPSLVLIAHIILHLLLKHVIVTVSFLI